MEFLYIALVFLTFLISELRGALYKEIINSQKGKLIYRSESEESTLQCAHRCRYIDKESAFLFQDGICECRRYTEHDDDIDKDSLSGLFLAHKKKRIEKIEEPEIVNVALGKAATQSSTYHALYSPSKAVDGDTRSRSITKEESEPWWEIDLGYVKEIKEIRLNANVGSSNNKGVLVETQMETTDSWKICYNAGDLKNAVTSFQCHAVASKARYVRIKATKTCYLYIYEVEIFGY